MFLPAVLHCRPGNANGVTDGCNGGTGLLKERNDNDDNGNAMLVWVDSPFFFSPFFPVASYFSFLFFFLFLLSHSILYKCIRTIDQESTIPRQFGTEGTEIM